MEGSSPSTRTGLGAAGDGRRRPKGARRRRSGAPLSRTRAAIGAAPARFRAPGGRGGSGEAGGTVGLSRGAPVAAKSTVTMSAPWRTEWGVRVALDPWNGEEGERRVRGSRQHGVVLASRAAGGPGVDAGEGDTAAWWRQWCCCRHSEEGESWQGWPPVSVLNFSYFPVFPL